MRFKWSREVLMSPRSAISTLLVTLVVAFLLSFVVGRYPIPVDKVIEVLASQVFPIQQTWPSTFDTIVMEIRLPRILAAVLVGASLSIAGAAFQGLFRNPLVSPDILGVSSGAGFGAALAILFYASMTVIQLSAFSLGFGGGGRNVWYEQIGER